jgi:hypothetical protein
MKKVIGWLVKEGFVSIQGKIGQETRLIKEKKVDPYLASSPYYIAIEFIKPFYYLIKL